MKIVRILLCSLIAICALSVSANAQVTYSNQFTGLGSSALFLELGKAAVTRAATGLPGGYAVCSWSTKDSASGLANRIYANDQAPAIANTGNFWVVWSQAGACTGTPTTGAIKIWSYQQQDSAVGNRCVFRTGSSAQQCILVVPAATAGTVTAVGGANLITGKVDITTALPAGIINALNGASFGVAGTDVRPEDSQFQIYRSLQSTGILLGTTAGAYYRGLGLASGSSTCQTIAVTGGPYDGGKGAGGAGTFGTPGSVTTAEFAMPGGTDPCTGAAGVTVANVIPVGATPVLVAVNVTDTTGFGSTTNVVSNINHAELAGFLDGDLCRTSDLFPQTSTTGSSFVTTLIREPFSGTYTTVEYEVAATRAIGGSQEYGIASPQVQPNTWTTCNKKGGLRTRVTSTGNEVYAVQTVPNSLGYFFWSLANGANFTNTNGVPTNAKYLSVDGVDPLAATYYQGCVPVASGTGHCAVSGVTFQNIKNGSYPIWSIQRLVTTCTAATPGCQQTEALAIAAAAQKAVNSALPDFVPATSANLHVFHSHYATLTPTSLKGTQTVSNGNCGAPEVGGDVGGVVYNTQSDIDYCSDFAVTNGITNINRLGSAKGNGTPGQRQ